MVYEYVCQTDWIDRERERDRETERQRDRETERQRDTDRGRERERDPLDEKARRFAEMNRGLHNEEMNQQEAQTRFEWKERLGVSKKCGLETPSALWKARKLRVCLTSMRVMTIPSQQHAMFKYDSCPEWNFDWQHRIGNMYMYHINSI